MRRLDIPKTIEALVHLSEKVLPLKLAWAIAKNLSKARAELELIQAATVPKISRYADWEKEKRAEALKLARKDEEGKPITHSGPSGGFFYEIDPNALADLDARLSEKYSEVKAGIEAHNAQMQVFMEELVEIDWYMIKVEWLEALEFTGGELEPILDLIEGEPV